MAQERKIEIPLAKLSDGSLQRDRRHHRILSRAEDLATVVQQYWVSTAR